VPVIFDEYVDPAFGTGALKVTPAHDINDYNLGLKHNLPIIDTLNADGTLSEAAKVFVGIERFEARKLAVERLRAQGLIVKEEEYPTRLGFSQRTNAPVEPRISTQWFVKMSELAGKALADVVNGSVKIHPEERFIATYKYWLENVKDWCISRQLWWGQRIPAWYDKEGNLFVAETEAEAKKMAGHASLLQDEDVLDTWFSSWLWPMEVFKGITEPGNKEIDYYYPTSVLVTGQDIIFFWVARMIMAGEEYMQQKPFDHVYFTGMVRDKQGRKMSKSLGNSPDLLDLIERFGADAVRFGILISSPAGNDLLFDDSSCEQGRNFNNKIWNALKLVQMWKERVQEGKDENNFAVEWFENRLVQVRAEVEEMYAGFRLSEALKTIYSLIWDDFCSWYLEWVKPGFEQPVNAVVYEKTVGFFEQLMQLLHPFMPFVTEEVYHHLRAQQDDLCVKQFPGVGSFDKESLRMAEALKGIISTVRDLRTKNNIKPKDPIRLSIQSPDKLQGLESILSRQLNAEQISYVHEPVQGAIAAISGKEKLYVQSEIAIDTNTQKQELLKELEYHKGFLLSVDKKLSNERFVQNAKADVVELERRKKADAEEKIRSIEESLKALS
jgi:valyl-tRNA synthetase